MNGNVKTVDTVARVLTAWAGSEFARLFGGTGVKLPDVSVVVASSPEFGDFQCNDSMVMAKVLKKPPRAIADTFVREKVKHPAIDRMEVAGPGFVNLFLNTAWLVQHACAMCADDHFGVSGVGRGQTIVLDYSSPNVAKPMHIGHIRSTIIGNALDRMHRFLGYKVISDNHLGDWGTQFGIIITGYRNFVDRKALAEAPVEELERVYVESYKKTKEDEGWLAQCRQELVKLQSGDQENRKLWKEFVDLSLEEFQRIYNRLGVSFDLTRGESYYNDKLKAIIELLEEKGLARESEGATVVFLDEEKLPVCIVRKSDGAFNYATSDLATVASRVNEFKPDKIVYVTDERQQLHFRQFFSIARKLGYQTRLDHVWFGLMRLPEGTFSTREGNVIKLERLLNEAEQRALDIVQKTSPEMTPGQQKEIARAVGIGAVKYADLSQNPQTTVTFTWEKALALDGNSGPYLQYAYARIASVLDKYSEKFPDTNPDSFPVKLSEPIERTLALILVRFPDIVLRASETYKPSILADYLYDLAQTYSTFYQTVPFLKAEEGVRESRVHFCNIVAKVLRTGLNLLNIESPQRI